MEQNVCVLDRKFGNRIVSSLLAFPWRLWQERPRLFNNPVILRELTAQLRKRISFLYLLGFLLTGFFCFLSWWSTFRNSGGNLGSQSRELFGLLNFLEGALILFFVPLFSAISINIERERETWELVCTTPLSLLSILWGKFLSSVLFVWFMMLSLIPVYGIIFTVGGLSPEEIFVTFILLTSADFQKEQRHVILS